MKNYLDRFNLRPVEKRLVVGVAAVFFVVLNVWFVVPHFADWGRVKFRMQKAQDTLAKYKTETNEIPRIKASIDLMKGEGFDIPAEDRALQFSRAVDNEAAQTGVNIIQTSKLTSKTNQFFLEQSESISVQSKEQPLVDFLYRLGSGTSLIRVRDLSLHTDAPRQQLVGTITLVASYQKKQPVRGSASSSSGAGARPATSTLKPLPSPSAKPPSGPPVPFPGELRKSSPASKSAPPSTKKP